VSPVGAYSITLTGPKTIQKGGSGTFTAKFSESRELISTWGVYKKGGLFGSTTRLAVGPSEATDLVINFTLSCDQNCVLSGTNSSGTPVGSTDATKSVSIFFENQDTPFGSTVSNSLDVQCVPEPLTILGSATAAGFGAFFKRKRKLSEFSEKGKIKAS
jgi:hypothetical protein